MRVWSEGSLHIKEGGDREEGCEVVGEDEVAVRGFEHEVQRHDGFGGACLDPEKQREEDGKDGE